MNPLNVVAAYNKNSVLPLAIFYRNHGYRTFVLLDNTEESKQISAQLVLMTFQQFKPYFLKEKERSSESIEDYIDLDDYLHPVNQTYEIKLRHEGFSNLTSEDVVSKEGKGILEKLEKIWQEHRDEDWGEFDNEEITRYICEKIALEDASFLSDKTKDQFRSLYRLIAERIRQYQNIVTKPEPNKFQKAKA